MSTLNIRNWSKWQSYRSDRGQPPWIKIHRECMRNLDWVSLTDAQRGQLVAIWLLAADRNGVIPASPSIIKKLCHLDTDPDLNLFIEHGFIESPQVGVIPASQERQDDDADKSRVETETETESHSKKPSRKKCKTTMPKDFSISDGVRAWAKENGHSRLEERLSHFITACQAKAYEYADWDAAFRNAISGDWAKLGGPSKSASVNYDKDEFMKRIGAIPT